MRIFESIDHVMFPVQARADMLHRLHPLGNPVAKVDVYFVRSKHPGCVVRCITFSGIHATVRPHQRFADAHTIVFHLSHATVPLQSAALHSLVSRSEHLHVLRIHEMRMSAGRAQRTCKDSLDFTCAAICHARRNNQFAFVPYAHASKALVPALDHFPNA